MIPTTARPCSAPAIICLTLLLSGCTHNPDNAGYSDEVRVIEEAFVSDLTRRDNIDSPAVWHAPDGSAWVLATAKSTHRLIVYDAATGETLGAFGGAGTSPGRFRRPNGILVLGDLALVVERDNRRVQVLRLPEGEPLGSFGLSVLQRPYGITHVERGPGDWDIYVADAYTWWFGILPPARFLGERIVHFRVRMEGDSVRAELRRSFGATSGEGVLRQVESMYADPEHDRLLIADEAAVDVKVYTLEGEYGGRVLGTDYLFHEPEGIALYACGDTDGYWIVTDQSLAVSYFHVLDRASLEHLGVFRGQVTANTDGVALTQRPIGEWEDGVFYPVHDDRGVAAFPWTDIAEALSLESCAVEGA